MDWEPEADLSYGAKLEVIRRHLQAYGLRTMIETGLYNGQGSGMQMLDLLDSYVVIDTDRAQCEVAETRGATAYLGDSGEVLADLLPTLGRPALFWLDAHLVATSDEENSSPLLAELDAILAWPHHRESVILVDDIRMMGRPGWPTLEHVRVKVGNAWVREERDDVLRLLPRHLLQLRPT